MIGQGSGAAGVYRVHGMMQSYFTRKMTGYLDYKGIPWAFRRFPGTSPEAMAAGFPGGMPVVETPAGEFMWDSTAMIHHLELRFPEPAVLPADPVQRFLCYVLEDAADEWLYRPAVGTRWHFPENAAVGGFELARDTTVRMPLSRRSSARRGRRARAQQLWAARRERRHDPVLGRRRAPAVATRRRRASRSPALPPRRTPVARRLRALRRQRGALRQRSALPPLDRRGCPGGRAAHAPPARAGRSGVRRVGRPGRRIRDVDRRARRAGAAVSPVGEPCVRRRRGRRRVRERGPRRRARDRLPARRPRDAARPLRREPQRRDSTTSSSARESCPSSPTTSRSPVRFPTSASRRGQR